MDDANTDIIVMILLGNLCSLFMYMGQEKGVDAQKCGKMREFLCEGFLKTVK